jgi:hypothetical protein
LGVESAQIGRALSGAERRQEIADVGHVHEDGILGESPLLMKVIQIPPLQTPVRRGIKPQRGVVHTILPPDVAEEEPNCGALIEDAVLGRRLRTPKECDDVGFIALVG